MNIFTKILVAVLAITSLIPLYVGILCLFDHPGVVQFFGLNSLSPDLEKVFFVLGGFVLATIVMPILAVVWLIKRKPEGYTIAYLAGFVALIRGILTFLNFKSHNIDHTMLIATPIVIGVLILVLTFLASTQQVNKAKLAN